MSRRIILLANFALFATPLAAVAQNMPGMTEMPPAMQMPGGAAMQAGCPMMKRMAALEERLRRFEEGTATPAPAPPR